MKTKMDMKEELTALDKELKWLLEEQVHKDLAGIHNTLLECSRRFPYRMGFDDRTVVKPQKNLLSNPNNTGNIKCVVTLLGDAICDADVSLRHKSGKESVFRTKISSDTQWPLQQVQDAANHLAKTLSIFSQHDPNHVYRSAKEVFLLLEDLMRLLTLGRTCLAFPKRKNLDDLIKNQYMQYFHPTLPSDVALSFYIHSSKLILAVYYLHFTSHNTDIVSRHQVECTVQWLNEAVILFSLAIQQCQELYDKIKAVQSLKDGKVT